MAQNFDPNANYTNTNPQANGGSIQPDPNNPYGNQAVDANYGYSPAPTNNPAFAQNTPVYDPNAYAPAPQQPVYDPNNAYNPGYNDINNANYGVQPTPAQNFETNLASQNGAFATDTYNTQTISPEATQYYGPQQPVQQPYNDASYSTNLAADPYAQQSVNNPNYGYEAPNTFVEKKSGNKFLMWVVIFAIIALLVVSGVLFFLSRNRATPAADTNAVASSSSSSSSDSSSTSSQSSSSSNSDNSQTPAQLAKIRNSTSIPATWLSQKFSNNGVDATGVCTNQNICGDSADPDNDGLSNLDEYNYDTDPQNDDTDTDGISDGNEIYIYYTSPRLKDSDRDGVADFAELVACNDPIKMSTAKTETARLDLFAQNTDLKPLKATSIKTFNANGATADDLKKGYLAAPCLANTSSAPVSSGTSTNSSTSGPSISL